MSVPQANDILHPARRVRALHVFGALSRGGAETWLMDVLRKTERTRLAIDVCAIGPGVGAYEDEFRALGGRLFRCPLQRNVFRFVRSFRRLLREQRFDVVHSHVYLFSGVVLKIAAKVSVPQRVAHIHPIEDWKRGRSLRSLYVRCMRRWIARYGTHFVAPTAEGLEKFWGPIGAADADKSVLYNGIQVARFAQSVDRAAIRSELGLPEESKIVLNVGRFAPHKRQLFLVDVAERLLERRRDVYFLLIGSGACRNDVMALAARKGLDKHFRWMEGAPDIDRFWLAADAFAFPSCNEGFGIVVAEAAAAGLPVVAQDIPGVREAVKACHAVTLLPLDADPLTWSHHLEKAVESGALCEAARREVLRSFPFTIERSVAALLRLYNLDETTQP